VSVKFGMRLGLLCASTALLAALAPAGISAAATHPGAMHSIRIDPLLPVPRTHAPIAPAAGSPWEQLSNPPAFLPGAMLLLTNGKVLVQSQGPKNSGSREWWLLTPSKSGSYVDGTWSKVASLPSDYAPLYFASAVLPDGRVIVMGGEYNFGKDVETNRGAIYDPVTNAWKSVSAPKGTGWTNIGDAPSTVLADGTFMLGASGNYGVTAEALLNAKKLTWRSTGAGKSDGNEEEGWSLLPNGKVLTVDTSNIGNSEIYNPATGHWRSAGHTPVTLIDASGEVGPQILRPNGTVFAVGATGKTAIFHTSNGTWSKGPTLPKVHGKQLDEADGPAAVLPDGEVLLDASPGDYNPPSRVFIYNGSKLVTVPSPPGVANFASNYVYMMVLPTGQVLFNDRDGEFEVYNPTGSAKKAWLPSVTKVPTTLAAGHAYQLSGSQLNGLTQASAYGDDYQSATNYPLVRLTSEATGDIVYARTYDMTSMTVKPLAKSSVSFAMPASIPAGTYTLSVVANGLASAGVSVTVTG
jgi:hypothetical protein